MRVLALVAAIVLAGPAMAERYSYVCDPEPDCEGDGCPPAEFYRHLLDFDDATGLATFDQSGLIYVEPFLKSFSYETEDGPGRLSLLSYVHPSEQAIQMLTVDVETGRMIGSIHLTVGGDLDDVTYGGICTRTNG